MGQHTGRLDRPVWAEHTEDRCWGGGRRDGANPKGTSRCRLQLSIHATQSAVRSINLAGGGVVGRVGIRAGRGALRRSNGSTLRFAKANTNCLPILHADVAAKAIEDIVLGADGIGLVDKVDETTFLQRTLMFLCHWYNDSHVPSLEEAEDSRWRRRARRRGSTARW